MENQDDDGRRRMERLLLGAPPGASRAALIARMGSDVQAVG